MSQFAKERVVRATTRDPQRGVITRRPIGGRRDTRGRAIHIKMGAESKHFLTGHLDGRTLVGKLYREGLEELKTHLNHDISVPEAKLCDQAVRLGLLSDLSWGEITQVKTLIKGGTPIPAIDVFLKASKRQRDVLALLGIKRKARQVNLDDYIASRGEVYSPSSQPDEVIDEPA